MVMVYSRGATLQEKLVALEELANYVEHDVGLTRYVGDSTLLVIILVPLYHFSASLPSLTPLSTPRCLLLGGILDSLLDNIYNFISNLDHSRSMEMERSSRTELFNEKKLLLLQEPKLSSPFLAVNLAKERTSNAAELARLSAMLCAKLARSHILYNHSHDHVRSLTERECLIEMILDVPHHKVTSTSRTNSITKRCELVLPSVTTAGRIATKVMRAKKEGERYQEEEVALPSKVSTVGSF